MSAAIRQRPRSHPRFSHHLIWDRRRINFMHIGGWALRRTRDRGRRGIRKTERKQAGQGPKKPDTQIDPE